MPSVAVQAIHSPSREEHPQVVAELAQKLEAWRKWAEQRRLEADSVEDLSAEELARLRSLGYI